MDKPSEKHNKRYSWETYQQLEESSQLRYEYHDGRIVAMAGANNAHNEIIGNCYVQLKSATGRKGCKTFMMEVRLFRHNRKEYFYPDVMASCQSFDLHNKNGVRNPVLVIEVLSKGTREYDRGFKLREYLKLPSLQHYLMVEQTHCEVQHYRRRADNSWEVLFYEDIHQHIDLPELELQLVLSDIYEGITFEPEPDMLEEPMPIYELIANLP